VGTTFSLICALVRWVDMKKRLMLRRGGPDILTEELVNAFSGDASFEFKSLFLTVHANLRARNAAHGGEEMLRLRLYEKLQNLVRVGGVEKTGKTYRGHRAGLLAVTEQMAANNCRDFISVVRSAAVES
jgi:hypothetical protein